MHATSTLSCSPHVARDTAAERAAGNFASNAAAIARWQAGLDARTLLIPSGLTCLFARDGSLTAMFEDTRWWAGCSVPSAAARFMLKSMEVRGIVGCFLNPLHAAQLRVALDLLSSRQALVAIVPDRQTLAVLLHAEDFSADIAAGRLWFAAGRQWEAELQAIFRDHPGLPTPIEFVRPITADPEPIDRLIDPAQRVFVEVSSRRTLQTQQLRERWRSKDAGVRRLCLLAPSEFRLWDDAALALADMDFSIAGLEVHRLDSDRPTSSSPLALALAASECDALLAANVFRTHLPGIIPDAMPWITWVTNGKIPPAADVGPNDCLLLAHSSLMATARQLGWAEARLAVASWPALPLCGQPQRPLAMIADTHALAVPKQIEGYSSQVLLWELIREELARDPFLAVDNMDSYLNSRRARLQIGDDGFDRSIFIDRLIVPAVQQGLARRLVRDGMPVRLFGSGWDTLDGLSPFHGGAVRSRQELAEILAQSSAVVDVWPWDSGRSSEMAGRPMIRTKRVHDFLSDVRQALNGTLKPLQLPELPITPQQVARMVRL